MTNTQSTPADGIDPRVIDAATAAMVSAIEWDIAIANDASQHSVWLTAFCTGGLAIIASQSEKLIEPSVMPTPAAQLALLGGALLFLAGGIVGGVLKRRIRRGIDLKRQQNTFFLKQKAVVLATPGLKVEGPVLENLWILGYLPVPERVKYLDVSLRDEGDQTESRLIPMQEILTLVGYVILVVLALARSFS